MYCKKIFEERIITVQVNMEDVVETTKNTENRCLTKSRVGRVASGGP